MSLETKILLAEVVDELNLAKKHLNQAILHADTAKDRKLSNEIFQCEKRLFDLVVEIRNKLDNHRG
jgi:hypothetical protein